MRQSSAVSVRWRAAAVAAGELERWLLPGACLVCGEAAGPADEDPLVCGLCRSRWSRVPDPLCARCGQPASGIASCRICREWPDGFGPVRSAVWLNERARHAVHRLKYDGWWRITDSLARAMVSLAPLEPGSVLVPIPLSVTRERHRGYNQSAILAQSLARLVGLTVDAALLSRRRDTQTQTALTPEEREANLRGAFQAVQKVPRRVVLVDDVFTTGSTLVSAAGALRAAGVVEVAAVTFARAERPLAAASATIGSMARSGQ